MVNEISGCPDFCQHDQGPCTRIKGRAEGNDLFFAYAGKPQTIGSQISSAAKQIAEQRVCSVIDWQDLAIGGRIVFCEICKSIRRSVAVVADITTLNDNVLFEIGYAMGLGKRVWPIKDISYKRDSQKFNQLRLLNYLGWTDFRNSSDIVSAILLKKPWDSSQDINQYYTEPSLSKSSKLFYLKSAHADDGSITLTASIKASKLPVDIVDPAENSQFSLRELVRRIASSSGVITHMTSPDRENALVHNAMCALMTGIAMAMEKPVLVVQEGEVSRPIDFGEIIKSYTSAKAVKVFVDDWISQVMAHHKSKSTAESSPISKGKLERLNLGDIAAENEIDNLAQYFVRTPIYQNIMNQRDALVIGRKGTGKTALFYEILRNYTDRANFFTLDLKPEGYQLTLFAEVAAKYSDSTKRYLIKTFWEYVLLTELGIQIIRDHSFAYQKKETLELYAAVQNCIDPLGVSWDDDFAQRLSALVKKIEARLLVAGESVTPGDLTKYLYLNDLKMLRDSVRSYLRFKDGALILVDNLDKDWRSIQDNPIELQIIRALIDSLKSISNEVGRDTDYRSVVFLRSDIHRLLSRETSDKGKDTVLTLNWQDREIMKNLIRERFKVSGFNFDRDWLSFFPVRCRGEDSFNYILDRTLMKPRDLLMFFKLSIDTAIQRNHATVAEDDIVFSEKAFSESMLANLVSEARDVFGDLEACILEFLGEPAVMGEERVNALISKGIAQQTDSAGWSARTIEVLLEFGFFGLEISSNTFGYFGENEANLQIMKKKSEKFANSRNIGVRYAIHPMFRKALDIQAS